MTDALGIEPVTDGAEARPHACQPWYAVQVRGRRENSTVKRYADLGFDAWLPTYKTETQWSDRVKIVERPLIPGYVFVRIPSPRLAAAIGVLHVLKVLGSNMFPTAISDSEISHFREVIDAGSNPVPCCPNVVGETVTIRKGPLAGQTGTVLRLRGETRLVVSLSMLGRAVSVEIDANMIKKP